MSSSCSSSDQLPGVIIKKKYAYSLQTGYRKVKSLHLCALHLTRGFQDGWIVLSHPWVQRSRPKQLMYLFYRKTREKSKKGVERDRAVNGNENKSSLVVFSKTFASLVVQLQTILSNFPQKGPCIRFTRYLVFLQIVGPGPTMSALNGVFARLLLRCVSIVLTEVLHLKYSTLHR